MESRKIKSREDEEFSEADEIEEDDQMEEEEEEEAPPNARELLQRAAAKLLASRVYSDDPPPEITEDVAEINEIPCTQEAADFVRAAEQNIRLANLQDKAARRIEKLKYLQEANRAKRCAHMKADGENCAGPALRGEQYCRFHTQSYTVMDELPVLEDRRSLQLAFSQLARATASAKISPSQATVLMQILDKAGRYLPEEKPERWDLPSTP